jgi:large subunit ribosomal protein L21
MYAIVKVGGKQYRVEKGDSIVVDRLREDEGAKVALEPLLYRPDGNGSPVFEGAALQKVKVEAVVKGHERGTKIRVLKFKPKVGYKRRTGHRSELTRLQIGDIKVAAPRRRAPAKKPPEGEQAEKAPAREKRRKAAAGEGAKKPASKKRAPAKGSAEGSSTKASPRKRSAKGASEKAPSTKASSAKGSSARTSQRKRPTRKKEDGDGA